MTAWCLVGIRLRAPQRGKRKMRKWYWKLKKRKVADSGSTTHYVTALKQSPSLYGRQHLRISAANRAWWCGSLGSCKKADSCRRTHAESMRFVPFAMIQFEPFLVLIIGGQTVAKPLSLSFVWESKSYRSTSNNQCRKQTSVIQTLSQNLRRVTWVPSQSSGVIPKEIE